MPLSPTSFVPDLIQNIIKRYAQEIENLIPSNFLLSENGRTLLVELEAVFGKQITTEAFRLLDEKIFTRYSLESHMRNIIEIRGLKYSANNRKLFLDINYCSCDFFRDHVLNVQKDHYYTCPHILAVQLAAILNIPVIREEIVSESNSLIMYHDTKT